jgi:sarcosine oxidase
MYDVIVVGLGAMGSAAVHHLTRRGLRVLGIEAFTPGHPNGSYHGESRVIRLAYWEHPDYVPLLKRAYQLWDELADESGARLLERTGGLFIGEVDGEMIQGTLASVREHSLAYEVLDADTIRRTYPALHARERDVAIFEEPAGFLYSERCVQAHVDAAVRDGAEVRYGAPVDEWRVSEDGSVEVVTQDRRYAADRLVVAAGAWTAKVLRDLDLPLRPERVPMLWFEPRASAEQFALGTFPVWLWDVGEPGLFYGFPQLDWPGVKVARHHSGNFCDPDTIQREMTPGDEVRIRAFLAEHIPLLDGRLTTGRICMYTNSPDAHFIVDRHPECPSVVFAGGFSGHGFKFASVIGEILADLSTDRQPTPASDFLRLGRLTDLPVAST